MLEQIIVKTNRRNRTNKEQNVIERKRDGKRKERGKEWKKKGRQKKLKVEIEDKEKSKGTRNNRSTTLVVLNQM